MRHVLSVFLPLFFCLLIFETAANEAGRKSDPLRSAALSGDVESQLKLATEFFFGGEQRPRNPVLAVYWFRKAAEQGNAEAAYNLGICLERGWGVELASRVRAYAHYSAAAEKGLPEAVLRKALLLAAGVPDEKLDNELLPGVAANRPEALRLLRVQAEKSYPPAQRELARMLLNDPLSRRDFGIEARKHLVPAAASGDVESLLLLAACYRDGIGGVSDDTQVVECYEKAAKLGSAEAKIELAGVLEYGMGVSADPKRAYELIREAAQSGSGRAVTRLGDYYLHGDMVEQSVSEAEKHYRQAFDSGYLPAATKLGRCAELGLGGDPDFVRAAELYGIAARAGDSEGQYAFGRCHLKGIGMAVDSAGAAFWFKTATAARHVGAIRELGICYMTGVGVEKDTAEGGRLLEAAAAAGDPEALMLINN